MRWSRLAPVCLLIAAMAGCEQPSEFSPQPLEAYMSNDAMRADVLARCDCHVMENRPLYSQSDDAECSKARSAEFVKSWGATQRPGGSRQPS